MLIGNGDLIDGKGAYSGGVEQTTTDRDEQADMAAECILYARAKKNILVYGTDTHTGKDEDWENQVARQVNGSIGGHEWVDINGLVFDCKHHLGSSSVPHARHTAIGREHLWSQLWAEKELTPKSDVIIRSHVHYFQYAGGDGWMGMSTPALQGMGSKFGSRRCSGLVDYGFLVFDVKSKTDFTWKPILMNQKAQKASVIRVSL